jgi:hypothetical protein
MFEIIEFKLIFFYIYNARDRRHLVLVVYFFNKQIFKLRRDVCRRNWKLPIELSFVILSFTASQISLSDFGVKRSGTHERTASSTSKASS